MPHLRSLWVALRSSLWFVPSFVVVVSMLASHVLVEAGVRVPALAQEQLPPFFGFSAEGSRAMLSAIATSMITVAGVAFSITIVTLSLASTQYSPRVLRQFMRDRANQWVLGIFVGIFAFCLTVLPRVRGGDEETFVPAIAVVASVAYALVGVGCLIFFIHHVAVSIQASCIVAGIAAETRATVDSLFPDELEGDDEDAADANEGDLSWSVFDANESGYIQLIADRALVRLAEERDVVIRTERGVGEFVVAGTPLVAIGGRRTGNIDFGPDALAAFTIYRTRTIEQDVMFGLRQIVDVALRALSPSLNDPNTAALCVNYVTTILRPLARRRMGLQRRRHGGRLRLIERRADFAAAVALGFGEIRARAGAQVLVWRELLQGIEVLEGAATVPARRAVIAAEAAWAREAVARIADPAAANVCAQADRLLLRLAPAR